MPLFPRPMTVIAGLALAGATGLPGPVAAQKLADIRAHIIAENPGCAVSRLEESFRGALPGAAGHVVVAVYTVEGRGGGNNWASQLGVFSEEANRVVPYALPDPPGFVVESARVSNGVIAVAGLDYAPTDGRCCPSIRREARYRVTGRTVAPAP